MGTRTAVYENRTYGGVRGALHQRPLVEPSTRLDPLGEKYDPDWSEAERREAPDRSLKRVHS